MNLNPICHSFPTKKMKCSFLDYVQLLMISQAAQWTQTASATPLQPKNEMLIFGLYSTSDDWPGWSMDSNPICHPSPAKKWNASFLDYIQLLMIGLGWSNPMDPSRQQKKRNACFWIMFTSDDLPGLIDVLEDPICQPKNEMFIFGLCSTSDDWPGWSMDSKKKEMLAFGLCSLLMICLADWCTWTPSATPLLPKKWNASFLDYTQLLMIGRAEWWTQTPSTTPLQPKNEMLNFGLHSTFDNWPGWLMDSNPIHHPSPANKMKSSFLYYVELLMINRAGWWSRTSSANPLQTIKWNAHFWILFNFWWSARLVNGPEPHPPRISSQKHEMLIYRFCSTSDDQPGWSRDSNPIHHPSPTNKMKCSFLDYAQLLMIGQAGWWTRTPSTTPLQPKKMKCLFLDYVHFWWSAWLIDELEPHLPPLSYQKNEILIFGFCSTSDDQPDWSMDSNPIHHSSPAKKNEMLVFRLRSLLMICLADWWTWTPSATPLQPKKWNAQFLIMFNFWWSARLGNGLKPHPPPFSSHKNEMPIFHYVQLMMLARLVNGLKPHPPPLSSQKKWNAYFWITFNFWWLARLVDGLKPHPPPVSSQKNEILIFVLSWTSDDQPGWLMDSNPICHPSPAKIM